MSRLASTAHQYDVQQTRTIEMAQNFKSYMPNVGRLSGEESDLVCSHSNSESTLRTVCRFGLGQVLQLGQVTLSGGSGPGAVAGGPP